MFTAVAVNVDILVDGGQGNWHVNVQVEKEDGRCRDGRKRRRK